MAYRTSSWTFRSTRNAESVAVFIDLWVDSIGAHADLIVTLPSGGKFVRKVAAPVATSRNPRTKRVAYVEVGQSLDVEQNGRGKSVKAAAEDWASRQANRVASETWALLTDRRP